MPGEYVSKPDAVRNMGVSALNALNRGGIPSIKSLGGGGGLNVGGSLMNITVQGNLDKAVMPDLERLAKQMMGEINKALYVRGISRTVNQYAN